MESAAAVPSEMGWEGVGCEEKERERKGERKRGKWKWPYQGAMRRSVLYINSSQWAVSKFCWWWRAIKQRGDLRGEMKRPWCIPSCSTHNSFTFLSFSLSLSFYSSFSPERFLGGARLWCLLLSVRDQYFKRPIKEGKIELGIDLSAIKVQSTIIKKHLKGLNRIHILKKNTRMDVSEPIMRTLPHPSSFSPPTQGLLITKPPQGRRPSGWRLCDFTF